MRGEIQVERRGRVLQVTIDRPEKRNALTQHMYGALADAIELYESSPELRTLVLTGRGDMFTAGNDLGDFATASDGPNPPVWRFLEALPVASKPLLAAVNGPAIGLGLTMLLHCDIVLASEGAVFSAPFVRLGLVPEAASSILLPAAVGMALANDILLTGRVLNAQEALAAGLVSRVLVRDALLPTTLELAQEMANAAPHAMRHSKALLRDNREQVLTQMRAERGLFETQLASSEFTECVQAFKEKRKPVFP